MQRHGFGASGWIVEPGDAPFAQVVARSGSVVLGSTRLLYARPDVDAALALPAGTARGFTLDCSVPAEFRAGEGIVLALDAVRPDGERVPLAECALAFSVHDYREHQLGVLFEPGFEGVLHREHIYGSGAPAPDASPDVVDLIFRYLGDTDRTIDVGCGIGAYGRAFRDRGRPWTGAEVRADFVERARADGLDAHVVRDGRLPFDDAAFDVAIAIEVIEHVEDLPSFLAEVARVAPKRALFSVPNLETVPVTSAMYALPWHMLEATHVNFFTRASLAATLRPWYAHVEVFEYAPLPLLRAPDGLPLHNQLFAVASAAA